MNDAFRENSLSAAMAYLGRFADICPDMRDRQVSGSCPAAGYDSYQAEADLIVHMPASAAPRGCCADTLTPRSVCSAERLPISQRLTATDGQGETITQSSYARIWGGGEMITQSCPVWICAYWGDCSHSRVCGDSRSTAVVFTQPELGTVDPLSRKCSHSPNENRSAVY